MEYICVSNRLKGGIFKQKKLIKMTTEMLARIDEAATALGIRKNSNAYTSAIEAADKPGTPVICAKRTGSGRFTKIHCWQSRTAAILMGAGIPYMCTNVAPRGGLHGNRITVII